MAPTVSAPRAGTAAARQAPLRAACRAGLLAGLWVALGGLVAMVALTVVAWLTAPHAGTSTTDAVRSAVRLWLLGHGTPLSTRAGRLDLVPLGLTLILFAVLAAVVARSARDSLPPSPRMPLFLSHVAGVGAGYTSLATAAYLWAGPLSAGASVAVVFGTLMFAVAAGSAGCLRGSGPPEALRAVVPAGVRAAVRGAASAFAVLLGGGLLLCLLAVALNFAAVMAAADSLDAGAAGNAVLLVVQAAYLPVFATWGASVAAGPGFAVGDGGVGLLSSTVVAPPAVPVLAAIPAAMPWWSSPAVLLPLCAGWAGFRRLRENGPVATVLLIAGMSVLTGAAWTLVCVAASGSLADGYYDTVGPAPLLTGMVVAAELALGAAAAWFVREGPSLRTLLRRGEPAGASPAA